MEDMVCVLLHWVMCYMYMTYLTTHQHQSIKVCKKQNYSKFKDSDNDELRDITRRFTSQYWTSNVRTREVFVVFELPTTAISLPSSLVRELDNMCPEDYHDYVLHKMTDVERGHLLLVERYRRKMFIGNWPHEMSVNLNSIMMAEAGFYMLDNADKVQCAFCQKTKNAWEMDDLPMEEHVKLNRRCRFVRGLPCGNVEYNLSTVSNSTTLRYCDLNNLTFLNVQDPKYMNATDSVDRRLRNSLGISTAIPTAPEFAIIAKRLQTFKAWPRSKVPYQTLCDAGFYFTGNRDEVICFHCSVRIWRWKEGDDPWLKHAKANEHCPFLINNGVFCNVEVNTTEDAAGAASITLKNSQNDSSQSQDAVERSLVRRKGDDNMDVGGSFDSINDLHVIREKLNVTVSEQRNEVEQNQDGLSPEANSIGYCRLCKMRQPSVLTLANHVGLPCGHVIYCDSCNAEIDHKSAQIPNYDSRCPVDSCQASLVATMKAYR